MTTTTITVGGMSCGHCVNSVESELGKVPGVQRVDVDLSSGRVTIESEQPIAEAAIAAAVDEAGYELVP